MSRTGDVGRLLPLSDLAFNLLVALTDRELHGYALIKELRLRTGRANLRTGTVYAALARLQDDGLIEETGPPEGDEERDARRRYYGITPFGVEVARAEAERLRELLLLAEARLPAAERA